MMKRTKHAVPLHSECTTHASGRPRPISCHTGHTCARPNHTGLVWTHLSRTKFSRIRAMHTDYIWLSFHLIFTVHTTVKNSCNCLVKANKRTKLSANGSHASRDPSQSCHLTTMSSLLELLCDRKKENKGLNKIARKDRASAAPLPQTPRFLRLVLLVLHGAPAEKLILLAPARTRQRLIAGAKAYSSHLTWIKP
jgi:hypothetical protein